jgi:hypothetical protein
VAERVRVHHSRELGEYVEYREPWRRSFLFAIPLLLVGLYIAVEAALGNFVVGCMGKGVEQVCGAPAVEPTRQSYYLLAAVLLLAAGGVIFRSIFRHPSLRIGTLGFEDRALRVHTVRWSEVLFVEPSRRDLLGRSVRIRLDRRRLLSAGSWMSVRVSGFSRPTSEIESEMGLRLEQARHIHGH